MWRQRLSTVCLQIAEGISLRTAWLLHCCAPSASEDSVYRFGSLDQNEIDRSYSMASFKARLDHPKCMFQLHSRDGLGLWLHTALYGNFWLSLGYQFGHR